MALVTVGIQAACDGSGKKNSAGQRQGLKPRRPVSNGSDGRRRLRLGRSAHRSVRGPAPRSTWPIRTGPGCPGRPATASRWLCRAPRPPTGSGWAPGGASGCPGCRPRVGYGCTRHRAGHKAGRTPFDHDGVGPVPAPGPEVHQGSQPVPSGTECRRPRPPGPLPTWAALTDQFDACGNLIEQTDRFGNSIGLTWSQSGQLWHLMSVTDSYGQVYKFDWSVSSQIKITSPPTAAKIGGYGHAPRQQRPARHRHRRPWSARPASATFRRPGSPTTVRLLHTVVPPTGETTGITYPGTCPTREPNLDVIVVDERDPHHRCVGTTSRPR